VVREPAPGEQHAVGPHNGGLCPTRPVARRYSGPRARTRINGACDVAFPQQELRAGPHGGGITDSDAARGVGDHSDVPLLDGDGAGTGRDEQLVALRVDRAAIRAEARLDGKWLIRSAADSLTPQDLALAYRQLYQVERGWRDLKGPLRLRPVFHRREDRIRLVQPRSWQVRCRARRQATWTASLSRAGTFSGNDTTR
jgi:hypothetical protein